MDRVEAAEKWETGRRISHKTGLPIRTILQDYRKVPLFGMEKLVSERGCS